MFKYRSLFCLSTVYRATRPFLPRYIRHKNAVKAKNKESQYGFISVFGVACNHRWNLYILNLRTNALVSLRTKFNGEAAQKLPRGCLRIHCITHLLSIWDFSSFTCVSIVFFNSGNENELHTDWKKEIVRKSHNTQKLIAWIPLMGNIHIECGCHGVDKSFINTTNRRSKLYTNGK